MIASKPGWKHSKLGECFKIKHGYAFKGKFFANEGRYVLLTPGNFNADGGIKLKGNKEKYYTGDFPDEYLMRRGEMLVVMTDLKQTAPILGSPAFIPEDGKFLHNQRLGRIVELDKSRMDKHFLYYLLNSYPVRSQIKATATGATVKHTAPDRIYAVEVSLPPLPTQRKIAAILSAYDDLIENNTRRIGLLEHTAQLLYREWFVHFRFPGHQSVPLVESELGPVPEGWDIKRVPDAIYVSPRAKIPKEGKKPFLPMKSLSETSMLIKSIESRTGNSGAKFKNGDTLFARITPCLENGKTGFVQFLDSDDVFGLGSTEFIVLRSKTLSPEYVYLMARSNEFRDHAIQSMTGATGRQRVQVACFDEFFIAHPDQETLKRFVEQASPLFRSIHLLARKNANLRATRDLLLLPRLISGQLDVSELDIAIGEIKQ